MIRLFLFSARCHLRQFLVFVLLHLIVRLAFARYTPLSQGLVRELRAPMGLSRLHRRRSCRPRPRHSARFLQWRPLPIGGRSRLRQRCACWPDRWRRPVSRRVRCGDHAGKVQSGTQALAPRAALTRLPSGHDRGGRSSALYSGYCRSSSPPHTLRAYFPC